MRTKKKKSEHVEERNSAERPGKDDLAGQLFICSLKSKIRKLLWCAVDDIYYCFMKAVGYITTEILGVSCVLHEN